MVLAMRLHRSIVSTALRVPFLMFSSRSTQVRQRVASAAARGQLRSLPGSSSPGLHDNVIAYVELLAQANSLLVSSSSSNGVEGADDLEFRNGDSLLWPRVYFCLR